MEAWLSTLDTREAAAFATLGVETRVISSLHERTGKRVVRFHLAPQSACGTYSTGKLRAALKAGMTGPGEPSHPLAVIMRAFHNREAILAMIHDGRRSTLTPVPGTAIWQYTPSGDGIPGLDGAPACIRTPDLNLASALATIGLPILAIDGDSRKSRFTIAAFGPPGIDGANLTRQWREAPDDIPDSHPFSIAARGLRTRSQLRRMVAEAIDSIIISKPNTLTHAIIRADASPKAWQKIARFFGG
jgi:hypothetical protein